jgi:hypothetical protein
MRAILAADGLAVLEATYAGISTSSLSGRIYSVSELGTGEPPMLFQSSLELVPQVEAK